MPLQPGDKLGPYEILAPIGAGGMGEVYRARDPRLNRDVAIKVSAAQFSERFEREAKAIAALNHPNICHLYDVGPNYLVMEYIEGEAPQGPLPFEEALRIAQQIALALEEAHEKNIVHRDLKPGNIKIKADGTVKVLDFGLAKIDAVPAGPQSENSPTLSMAATQMGVILGTAAYMSPEQARGKTVDKRADIWAFGVVFHEILTGKRLFQGEDVTETMASVVKEQPDLSGVPSQVRRLLQSCLEKDPKKRLQAIGDFRLLLEAPPVSVGVPVPTGRAGLWTAVAALMAIVAAVFAWLWLRPAPPPQVMRFEIHAPSGSTLPLGTPAISADGRTLAFTMIDPDGITRIHLRPIDRIETRVLPGTEGAIHPFWSPDGRSLGFATPGDARLKRIDVAGGGPRELTAVNGPWHGSWNQNGDILFAPGGPPARIAAEGGPTTPVAAADQKKGETGIGFPFFLADGKRFLVRVAGDKTSIQLAKLGSMERTMVIEDVDSAPILAPTPKGKTYLLFLRSSDLLAQEFDESSGSVRGSPVVVISDIGKVASPPIRAAFGVSPAGILAYQTGSDYQKGQLTWVDRSGKTLETLPAEASGNNPALSPDGSAVAMARTDASGNEDVWVTELARKSSVRLTFSSGRDFSPVWSPDGKRLAFFSLGAKPPGVYTVDANDSSKTQILRPVFMPTTSWSPDGKYVQGQLGGTLTLVPVTGDEKPIPVGSRNGRSGQGRFSPDGKYIAFTSSESGRGEVYIQPMPPATGQWKVSIDGGTQPRWRRDGKELYFVSREGIMAADIKLGQTVSVGVPHKLFQLKDGDISEYDVRADGQQFLVFVPQGARQDAPITVVLNWWTDLEK
jgi:eukaryotic-like serine/threonine-protein kinase